MTLQGTSWGRAMTAAKKPFTANLVQNSVSENRAERRQAPRVFVDLEVDYGNEDTFLFAYITDISATGIFVRTNTPESPGTKLNVRFSPNTGEMPLELEGEVAWINPYRPGHSDSINPGMGIRFLDLTDQQRWRLTEFVKTFAYLSDNNKEE